MISPSSERIAFSGRIATTTFSLNELVFGRVCPLLLSNKILFPSTFPLIKSTLPTKFATNIFLGLEYISCGGATCCTSPLLIKTILSLIVIASI